VPTLARQQRGHSRDRRGIADRDMAHVADHARDHVGEEFRVTDGAGIDGRSGVQFRVQSHSPQYVRQGLLSQAIKSKDHANRMA
jgi:hypothetical protein